MEKFLNKFANIWFHKGFPFPIGLWFLILWLVIGRVWIWMLSDLGDQFKLLLDMGVMMVIVITTFGLSVWENCKGK